MSQPAQPVWAQGLVKSRCGEYPQIEFRKASREHRQVGFVINRFETVRAVVAMSSNKN
jgi:hypothetical protein